MSNTQSTPAPTGIVVSTAITAGGWSLNHAESIAVSNAVVAGFAGASGGIWK